MTEQETPKDIAADLMRYLPRKARDVLDPCTGNGALISSILNRSNQTRITALDIRPEALANAKQQVVLPPKQYVRFVLADFLHWKLRHIHQGLFDCVVMNPPFHARKEHYLTQAKVNRVIPIELAFVLKAVDLLRHKGRLLAVLPFSSIASSSASWFRRHYNGSI